MENQRKMAMLSNSTSATSLPGYNKENKYGNGESTDLFIKQLQQQVKAIRTENEDFAKNSMHFQQRINKLEEDKVVISRQFNKENAELQAIIARLQSQLEHGEADRQSIEYELTVAKKKLNDVTRSTTHKEVTLAKENIQLSDDKSSLELKIGELENELIVSRQLTAENEKRIAVLEENKRQMQSDNMTAEAILRAENDKSFKRAEVLQDRNEELSKELDDVKQGLLKQEDELRRVLSDLQASVDREQRYRHELEELSHRARSLEESVEAERAAHLESKFNSEIIQLKHQEFQSQLSKERDLCEKLQAENKEISSNVEALEKQLEFERHQTRNANAKLEKTMQVYADVRKQLDEEIAVKSHVIEETARKLEAHQNQLDQVKDELSKARKKMLVLEESQSSGIRELELLLNSFCTDVDPSLMPRCNDKKPRAEQQKVVLESLRKTLLAYQKNMSHLQGEIDNRKTSEKEAEKDCENFRDLALAREKSMQHAQQALSECEAELEVIRNRQAEYERETGRTSRDLEEATNELQLQTQRCQQLEENLNSIQDRHKTEIEIHVGFLRELHHVVCSASGEKNTLTRFGWSDLSVTIRESVDTLINNHQRAKDKITELERAVEETQRSINELERAHSASVDRLAARCRERDDDSTRQRKELEQHYQALLAEMHSRTQKTQSLCDEAWERVRSKDGLQDGLHAECAQLRGENSNLQQERQALASACAILFGALYPTLRARDELSQQRALLARINNDGEICKQKMRALVDTLTDEMSRPDEAHQPTVSPKSFRLIHPLIRFRVGAICILAANRLRSMNENSNVSMFTCNESAISSSRIVVVAGKAEKTSPKPKTKGDLPVKSRSDAAVDWLSDSHVVHGVRDATCGVVDAVAKNAGDSSGYMSRAVVKTAKNAFLNLMECTHSRFSAFTVDARNILRERTSLCRVLADGLDRVIHSKDLRPVVNLFSVEFSFSALQCHLLSFTERLHAAEIEKRNLRKHEAAFKSTVEQLNAYKAELDGNDKEIRKLRDKERQLVSKSRFDGVCAELAATLEREKKTQQLLREQNTKLLELGSKYEEQCSNVTDKDLTLTQAVTSLSQVKIDLKRCEQNKRQMEKQVEKLQVEKEKLQCHVNEAKSALKKAAGEKTSIANYFANVEQTLQHSTDEDVTEKLRLKGDEMSVKAGPGLKAAKRAVESFVRVQSSAMTRINNLENQIASYRSHISSLKRELYNACHRENENPFDLEVSDMPTRDDLPRTAPSGGHISTLYSPFGGDSEFKPLQGEVVEQSSFFEPPNGMTKSLHSLPIAKESKIGLRDLTSTFKPA